MDAFQGSGDVTIFTTANQAQSMQPVHNGYPEVSPDLSGVYTSTELVRMHRSRAIGHTPNEHNLNSSKPGTRLDKRVVRVIGTSVAPRCLPDGHSQDLLDIGFDKESQKET
jgi:hypothetical protein